MKIQNIQTWLNHLGTWTVLFAVALAPMAPPETQAEVIGGVNFPQGVRSFADAVVGYSPAGSQVDVSPAYRNPQNAIGVPNYGCPTPTDPACGTCPDGAHCSFVSLGGGGILTLRFTDNALTGSGSTNIDLWIFEVGTDVEPTFVEISKDGATWHSVGQVGGSTSGIDLDAFGFGSADRFHYVRLTDGRQGQPCCQQGGADIDAVGAISSADTAPAILIQPQNVASIPGETITFSVNAVGTPPLSYQWRLGNADIPDGISRSLTLTNVNTNQIGGYSVLVTSPFGSVTSIVATLELAIDVQLATATAIVWPSMATRAGFVLEEADHPNGPWGPSAHTPGSYQDRNLILADTGAVPKKYYRLRRP